MSRTILIDGDVILYQAAASSQERYDWGDVVSENADLDKARETFDRKIRSIVGTLSADEYYICLSDRLNWRKDILPTYKANRTAPKPVVYWDLKEYVHKTYRTREHARLEADDVLGLLMTGRTIRGERVCVTIDKDLRTVPGLHWNPLKPERGVEKVNDREAALLFLRQCLTGDPVDGYSGCPGIGPKKADRVLAPVWSKTRKAKTLVKAAWPRIIETYESRGLTEEDALIQARVARILQYGEYQLPTAEVTLWTPPR